MQPTATPSRRPGWFNGTRGRYDGSLGGDRRLSGITFDLNHPSSQATWSTSRTF
ncbi:hypothetical protein [Actinomadura sp. NPDC049753]|uniref:hypothetical protein n=1 Tax=Actinomadura sp. NPDC049753 TaxID=3154739 RepID=UPI00343C7EAA